MQYLMMSHARKKYSPHQSKSRANNWTEERKENALSGRKGWMLDRQYPFIPFSASICGINFSSQAFLTPDQITHPNMF
jgi:hypothetical protein